MKAYRAGHKRVPEEIDILELMLILGKEVLEGMLNRAEHHQVACGTFRQKLY
ncbi:hypothetical protein N752_21455 [Desulforamulus aquiferis]|nr:hypothetical protein [Desulforamulus aquiferis]RYD02982.1 hypothetical protein N752_21455 [Desulforamulus aquiferis]